VSRISFFSQGQRPPPGQPRQIMTPMSVQQRKSRVQAFGCSVSPAPNLLTQPIDVPDGEHMTPLVGRLLSASPPPS